MKKKKNAKDRRLTAKINWKENKPEDYKQKIASEEQCEEQDEDEFLGLAM